VSPQERAIVEEIKRHNTVLQEQMIKEVRTVAEGHGILNKKIDHLDEKVDHLDKKVDRLDKKVDHLDKKVDHLDKKVDHLDKKVDHLDKKVDHLASELETVKIAVLDIGRKVEIHDEKLARL
jgi:peptidoglycan hydrolase CwlO-like protein